MSKHCQSCALQQKKLGVDSPEYAVWYDGHKSQCNINHTESSGAMEKTAAEILWKRSESYGCRFTSMISDGNANAFNHVANLKVYGDDIEIEKQECVNHVNKRIRTALEKHVKEWRSRGITLGGKSYGSLKEKTIVKLASYYRKAIYDNKDNVPEMRKAILASLYHAVSTDKNPQHIYCPTGPESWCFFQKDVANGVSSGRHVDNVGTPIKEEFLDKILPIYEKLSDVDLLKRCSSCVTQNANEALHHVIWNKCAKEKFVSKKSVKLATIFAVSEFKFGLQKSIILLQNQVGLSVGKHTIQIAVSKDRKRIKKVYTLVPSIIGKTINVKQFQRSKLQLTKTKKKESPIKQEHSRF